MKQAEMKSNLSVEAMAETMAYYDKKQMIADAMSILYDLHLMADDEEVLRGYKQDLDKIMYLVSEYNKLLNECEKAGGRV